jgi:hypothetical protein
MRKFVKNLNIITFGDEFLIPEYYLNEDIQKITRLLGIEKNMVIFYPKKSQKDRKLFL